MIKNQKQWLSALPFGLALKSIGMSLARKVTGLPITFSYAEGAEDIIVPYLYKYHFGLTTPGRYVDVGCNHPIRYSNTFALYLIGWRGVNIDANSDLVRECRRVRRQDICIQAAVSDSEREVTFHKAKELAVSTIDEERFVEWKKHFEFSDDDQETVVTKTLTAILDENWKIDRPIDLLSIDVEGHDLQVLRSLDLSRYRPRIIVIEVHDLGALNDTEIYAYLTENGYSLKFMAVLNAYFVDSIPSQA